MSENKFQNKYRIPSARANWWNYANKGVYHITINTFRRRLFFGKIIDEQMFLSEYGKIALEEWNKSFVIRTNLFCETFVIMPDHIHGLVRLEKRTEFKLIGEKEIDDTEFDGNAINENQIYDADLDDNPINDNQINENPIEGNPINENPIDVTQIDVTHVETHSSASLQKLQNHGVAYRPPKSLSSFAGGFKSAVTKRINETPARRYCRDAQQCVSTKSEKSQKINHQIWQPRFHDRIVRNQEEYNRIFKYIQDNPKNWKKG